MYSLDTTKYLIHIHIDTEGVVEKPDVIGAVFGQTEGLLGEDMDLRDLQRSGKVGRIDVQISSKNGRTTGELFIASSLDRAETAILAAAMETIDRIGPCVSSITVVSIEDLRAVKRRQIASRAKELLIESFDEVGLSTNQILSEVREITRAAKAITIGDENIPAGPSALESDAIIIVEGRADVLNLLRCGIKNTVAVEGTKVPEIVIDLSRKKSTTVFVDGDRGGDLILQELLQVGDIDYIAFSQRGRSVEDMTRKEIVKSLKNKIPAESFKARINKDTNVSELIFEITSPYVEEKASDDESVIKYMSSSQDSEDNAKENAKENVKEDEKEDAADDVKDSITEDAKTNPNSEQETESESNEVLKSDKEESVKEESKSENPETKHAQKEENKHKKPENPITFEEHIDYMRQTGRGRIFDNNFKLVGDFSLDETRNYISEIKDKGYFVIIDDVVNQKFVDIAFSKGVMCISARKFDDIEKKPVGIRLIPF
ncbi:MAG TPA: DNA primase DnaG [Methanocorpusculum sp.]|nr:DNA primase DnaG [Methanocorpusculum sp.]